MKRNNLYLVMMSVCILLGTTAIQAQSVTKILKSTANQIKGLNLEGTWNYEGAAVQFKSKNLLKKAGGKIASSKIENNLNEQLQKIGFEPGVTTFIFNGDGTFSNTTGGKTISGKYTYDSSGKEITLKYLSHIPIKAKVSGSGSKASLLFEANSFLSFVTFLGSHSGISLVKGVTSILNSYDGMMVGLELSKE